MLIDWFTVCAQAINFLILVWLLKRFLYKPILTAIDAREKLIAQQVVDANARMTAASNAESTLQTKRSEFDAQRATLMERAIEDAHHERLRLVEAAQQEADRVATARRESLINDAHVLSQALIMKTQKGAFAIAEKTLKDLSDSSLNERICTIFTHRLSALDGMQRADLVTALETTTNPILIRTAHPLSLQLQTMLRESVLALVATQASIQYVAVPDLIGGIELSCNGQKISWDIAHHLATLAKGVEDLFTSQFQSQSTPATAAP